MATDLLLQLQGVCVGYREPLLPPLDLPIAAGERLGILGPNGAGKSTLLKTVLGLIPPLGGVVHLPLGRRPRIGYVPQTHRPDPAFPLDTLDVVLMGRYPRLGIGRRPGRADRAAALARLEEVGLAEACRQHFGSLSGGQRQRALVARALLGDPELLVLDEPTSELDPAAQHELLRLVGRLASGCGSAVLFVTHEICAAAGFATSLALVDRFAGLVEVGPAEQMLTSERLSRLYRRPIEVRREAGRTLVWTAADEGGP